MKSLLSESIERELCSKGEPIDDVLRARLERFFGADLSCVRIHQQRLPKDLPFRAGACGERIFIEPGRYDATTPEGIELLAHEVTHVLQQRAGRVPQPAKSGELLVIDPSLEREAELMGWLASLPDDARPAARELLPLDGRQGRARGDLLQPVVHVTSGQGIGTYDNGKYYGQTGKKFTEIWQWIEGGLTTPDYPVTKELKPTKKEIAKAKSLLREWVGAAPSAKSLKDLEVIAMAITGKNVWELQFNSLPELMRCLIGTIRGNEGKSKEQELAKLIGANNKAVAKLLQEALGHIAEFHKKMKGDSKHGKKYKELVRKKRRAYNSYYTKHGSLRYILKKKGISVDDAFKKLSKGRHPSYQIVAFMADYAKIAKEVMTDYLELTAGETWSESDIIHLAKQMALEELSKQAEEEVLEENKDKLKKKRYSSIEKIKDLILRKKLEVLHRRRLLWLQSYQGHTTYERYFRELSKDDEYAKEHFKGRLNREERHIFYKLPGLEARRDGGGVNEYHEWIKKGRDKHVPFGEGPSATTMFLLAMLKILYPRDEAMLAAAVAIFEFWNAHYKPIIEPGIHTWHEVMVVAKKYVQRFNFTEWRGARGNERPRKNWEFEYPNKVNLKKWLKDGKIGQSVKELKYDEDAVNKVLDTSKKKRKGNRLLEIDKL